EAIAFRLGRHGDFRLVEFAEVGLHGFTVCLCKAPVNRRSACEFRARGYAIRAHMGLTKGRHRMRKFWIILLLLSFVVAASGAGTGCRQSTREDLEDDEVGPESSGPYAADLLEVTDEIADQIKKQKITERFIAKWGDAPIVAVIRPQN